MLQNLSKHFRLQDQQIHLSITSIFTPPVNNVNKQHIATYPYCLNLAEIYSVSFRDRSPKIKIRSPFTYLHFVSILYDSMLFSFVESKQRTLVIRVQSTVEIQCKSVGTVNLLPTSVKISPVELKKETLRFGISVEGK